MNHHKSEAGAAVYSPWVLKIYDLWVLGLSNRLVWRCPTSTVLLPFFRKGLSERHLDIGVGTGYYLEHSTLRPQQELTLLDLNANSLAAARERIAPMLPKTIVADILEPGTALQGTEFDSISLFYLLHCLPGALSEKGPRVFGLLSQHLSDQGTLYGATILGDSAPHNALGRKLMAVYSAKGIFGNSNDTLLDLEAALRAEFSDVHIEQHGVVALFTARAPRRR